MQSSRVVLVSADLQPKRESESAPANSVTTTYDYTHLNFTHCNIWTVHCFASCGSGGGCATWKSTKTAARTAIDVNNSAVAALLKSWPKWGNIFRGLECRRQADERAGRWRGGCPESWSARLYTHAHEKAGTLRYGNRRSRPCGRFYSNRRRRDSNAVIGHAFNFSQLRCAVIPRRRR